jgi:hypothetical protein
MRIKWSPVEVMDATDVLDGHINKIIKPLQKAKAAAEKAKGISNLPDYVKYQFANVIGEIERTIGGTHSWDGKPYPGLIKSRVESIRKAVPQDALAEARSHPPLLRK